MCTQQSLGLSGLIRPEELSTDPALMYKQIGVLAVHGRTDGGLVRDALDPGALAPDPQVPRGSAFEPILCRFGLRCLAYPDRQLQSWTPSRS